MTVIVNDCGAPAVEHPFKVGVTVTVEICCVATFDAVNAPILPVPLAVKPVLVLLFAHAKVAPEGVLLKMEATTFAPAQTVWLIGTTVTTGFGLIVNVNVCEAPTQPFKVGVTVIVEIC